MKEKYERIELTVTRFSGEDVITTSVNNAYVEENVFDQTAAASDAVKTVPQTR